MTNPAPTPEPTPAPKPPAGKRRQLIVLGVLLVLAAICFGGVWFATRSNATNAKVGDCVHQTGAQSIKIVKCTDSTADFKVVGRVEGKEQIESTIGITSVCDQWQETTNTYWEGKEGKKGTVLCLSKTN